MIQACFKALHDIGLEMSKYEPSTSTKVDDENLLVGLSTLLSQESTHEQRHAQYYSLILSHPDLRATFLWRPDITQKKTKYMRILSKIITKELAALVGTVPTSLLNDLSSELNHYISQISQLLKDTQDAEEAAVDVDVLHAIAGFMPTLPNQDFILILRHLCQMPVDQLTREEGQYSGILMAALKLLVTKSCDHAERINYMLPLSVVRSIWKLVISGGLDELAVIMVDLLHRYPHFAYVAPESVLHHCLDTMTTASCQLSALLVATSRSCRDQLVMWLENNEDKMKKKKYKQGLASVVLQLQIHSSK